MTKCPDRDPCRILDLLATLAIYTHGLITLGLTTIRHRTSQKLRDTVHQRPQSTHNG